jgi:hypothetical protein
VQKHTAVYFAFSGGERKEMDYLGCSHKLLEIPLLCSHHFAYVHFNVQSLLRLNHSIRDKLEQQGGDV